MTKKGGKTMKIIEIENVNVQIEKLQKTITDLKIMGLTVESMELMKDFQGLYIQKTSELLNAFCEKFSDISQDLDDAAVYLQNLVEELEG